MEFDPYSEPRSMGVNTLNQYFGTSRRVVREDRRLSPELSERDSRQKPISAKVSPGMAFQNRRIDKSGQFVDFKVPSGVLRKAVRDWIQNLCDPAQMDPQELYVSFPLIRLWNLIFNHEPLSLYPGIIGQWLTTLIFSRDPSSP